MPIQRKKRTYRKRTPEEEDEVEEESTATPESNVSETIEELQELRKLRRKHGGIDTEKLLKGSEKPVKKKERDPWGLTDKDVVRAGIRADDEEGTEKKLKLDSFTTQTNALDVDKHMMAYIEAEMRKRRGEPVKEEDEEDDKKTRKAGPLDIYEELYHLPERLRVEQKKVQEGSMQLSTQMLTAIPEVDLGIDVRLQNIEETERAKRKYMNDRKDDEESSQRAGEEELDVPANYEKRIQRPDQSSRIEKRQTASDDLVAERFKKRMRK